MKSTRWIHLCGLLAMIVLLGACSNRQADDRVIATEVATNTLLTDVQALEQRMQSLEGHLSALSTEVGSLEIKTLKGAKTSYMVVPAVKATPYIPLTTTNAAPQAASTPVASVAPAASAQAPVAASPTSQAAPVSQTPVASGVALPPTSTPMPAQPASPSAQRPKQTTTASAPQPAKTPPASTPSPAAVTTPIPVQSAVSLALPPESPTAVFGQPAQQGTQQATQVAPAPPAVAQSPAKAGTPVPLAPLAPKVKGEERAYNAALALARGGKPAEAINSFTVFLQEYPTGRYAPNAYYWMGECLYAQRNYADALLQFKDVAARYPRHHKTADALLKAGMTYDRLGDKENAALQYKALVTDFPSSDAARRVKGRGAGR